MVSPVTAPHSLTVAVAAHDMNGQAHVGRKMLRLKHIQYNIYIYNYIIYNYNIEDLI